MPVNRLASTGYAKAAAVPTTIALPEKLVSIPNVRIHVNAKEYVVSTLYVR